MFETRDIPLHDFPEGEGPPIFMTAKHGTWARLGFGQGQLVRFSEEPEGAYAFGLVKSVVVIWVYLPPDAPGRAYCYHAPLGALTPRVHHMALAELECGEHPSAFLYAVVASERVALPVRSQQYGVRGGSRIGP